MRGWRGSSPHLRAVGLGLRALPAIVRTPPLAAGGVSEGAAYPSTCSSPRARPSTTCAAVALRPCGSSARSTPRVTTLQLEQRGAVVGREVGPGGGRQDAAGGGALAEGGRRRFEQGAARVAQVAAVAFVDHRRYSCTAMPEAARHSSTRRRARVTFWRKVLSCIATRSASRRSGSAPGRRRGGHAARSSAGAGACRCRPGSRGAAAGRSAGQGRSPARSAGRAARSVVAAAGQVRRERDLPPPPPRLVDRQVAGQPEREAQRGVLTLELLRRRDDPHPQQRLLHDRLDVDRTREGTERAPRRRLASGSQARNPASDPRLTSCHAASTGVIRGHSIARMISQSAASQATKSGPCARRRLQSGPSSASRSVRPGWSTEGGGVFRAR